MSSQTGNVGIPYPSSAAAESLERQLEASRVAATEIVESAEDANAEGLLKEQGENATESIHTIRLKKAEPKSREVKIERKENAQESVLVRKEDANRQADEFSQKRGNREYRLDSRILSALLSEDLGTGIHEEADEATILGIIRSRMTVNGKIPDAGMVDKAFEFLLEGSRAQLPKLTGADKERLNRIIGKIEAAKNQHAEIYAAAIQVTQNIIGAVDAVATGTDQDVPTLLGRYSDVVANTPDAQTLLKAYPRKDIYKHLRSEFQSLSRYLNDALKEPDVERPYLVQLNKYTRVLQAELHVFHRANERLKPMKPYLESHGMSLGSAAA